MNWTDSSLLALLFHSLCVRAMRPPRQAKERCRDDEQADEDSQAAVEEAVKKLRIVPYEAAAGKHLGPRRGSTAESERNLGKPLFDERRIAAGLPCGTENFLLIFARWKKLERDFYNPRKE